MSLQIDRRRFLALSGVSAGALALSACSSGDNGSGPSDGEPASLSMTIFGGEHDLQIYTDRVALAKDLYPEIDVEIELVVDDYNRKLQTMIAGGTPPDIMHVQEGIHAFSSRGTLEPLDSYIEEAGLDLTQRFGERLGQRYVRDGSVWGLPDRGGAMVLYFNKDMFDVAGLDYPDNTWGWDEFLSAAQELTIRDGDEVTQWGYACGDWWPWWAHYIYGNGGAMFDTDGRTPMLDDPASIEGMQFFVDYILTHKVAPTPRDSANMGLGWPTNDTLFMRKELALNTTGYWFIGSLQDSDINWGVTKLMDGPAATATPAFGNGFAIPAGSQNKAAAFKILDFLSSHDGQVDIATTGQDVPTNAEVLESPAFLEPAWAEGNAEVDLTAFNPDGDSTIGPFMEPEWEQCQAAFTDAFATVWTGETSVPDAMARAQADFESIVGA